MEHTNNYYGILDVIYSVMGRNPKKHNESRHQISYNCPHCDNGRNKGKLEINYNKLVMKCWSCGEQMDGLKGSLFKLIKEEGDSTDVRDYLDAIDGHIINGEVIRVKDYQPNIHLPKEYKKITPNNLNYYMREAYTYLKNRGITDDEIVKYKIGYCNTGYYGNRVIVPSYDRWNKLNFFVGRTYTNDIPKYMNPEVLKYEIIINEDNINWDSTIYLVEGMFDMIGLGLSNTIPLLGKTLAPRLYEYLIEKAMGDIIIMLDPEAIKDAIKIYRQLDATNLSGRVYIIELPMNMDIAEIKQNYGSRGVLKCLHRAKRISEEEFIEYELI